MELRNKGTLQNVTNIESNVCFCYKCIINNYVQLQIVIDLYVSIIYTSSEGIIHRSGFGIFVAIRIIADKHRELWLHQR